MTDLQESLKQLRMCMSRYRAQGASMEAASAACRHGEGPVIKMSGGRIQVDQDGEDEDENAREEGIAGNFGDGWRAGSGDLGSGKVVKSDPKKLGTDWHKSLKRSLEASDEAGWREYAKRNSLDPDETEDGWNAAIASNNADSSTTESADPAWTGYATPFSGNLESPRQFPQQQLGAGSFSYRTNVAEKVWDEAQKMVAQGQVERPQEIIGKAINNLKLDPASMAPEDLHMLKIGIEWMQNGPAKSNVRTAGARADLTNRGAP